MKKLFNYLVVLIMSFMALFMNSCWTVVEPDEVVVIKNMGQISDVYERGSGFHGVLPWETTTSIPLTPQQLELTFTVGDDGAITKDMQTIGMNVSVVYNFREDQAVNYVKSYSRSSLENLFQTNVKSTIKEVIGKYSIYDLTSQTESISKQVWDEMNKKCANMPIVITQLNVNNWSWSESFDKQIQETMKRTQMEKTAKADVAIAEAAAQKQVKEAEAKKQADLLKADAELEVAKKKAEAAKVAADADLYVKTKMAQQITTNERQWKHEETMAFLEKWNGKMPGADATTNVGGHNNTSMIDAIMAKALNNK